MADRAPGETFNRAIGSTPRRESKSPRAAGAAACLAAVNKAPGRAARGRSWRGVLVPAFFFPPLELAAAEPLS